MVSRISSKSSVLFFTAFLIYGVRGQEHPRGYERTGFGPLSHHDTRAIPWEPERLPSWDGKTIDNSGEDQRWRFLEPTYLDARHGRRSPSSDRVDIPESSITPKSSSQAEDNRSFVCTEAGYFPHPDDCEKFVQCVDWLSDGTSFSRFDLNCAPGTEFNPRLALCSHPSGQCQHNSSGISAENLTGNTSETFEEDAASSNTDSEEIRTQHRKHDHDETDRGRFNPGSSKDQTMAGQQHMGPEMIKNQKMERPMSDRQKLHETVGLRPFRRVENPQLGHDTMDVDMRRKSHIQGYKQNSHLLHPFYHSGRSDYNSVKPFTGQYTSHRVMDTSSPAQQTSTGQGNGLIVGPFAKPQFNRGGSGGLTDNKQEDEEEEVEEEENYPHPNKSTMNHNLSESNISQQQQLEQDYEDQIVDDSENGGAVNGHNMGGWSIPWGQNNAGNTILPKEFQLTCGNDEYRRHPVICNQFYRCIWSGSHWLLSVASCAPHHVFDEKLQLCRRAQGDECKQEEDGEDSTTEIISERRSTLYEDNFPHSGIELRQLAEEPESDSACYSVGFYHVEFECSYFLHCALTPSNELQGFLYKCPDGHYFDNSELKCQPRENETQCPDSPDSSLLKNLQVRELPEEDVDTFFKDEYHRVNFAQETRSDRRSR